MKKLLKYMKEYRMRCVLAPSFKMLEAAAELFVPLVMADIIDVGIKNNDKMYILSRCGLLGLLAVLGLSFTVVAQYFSATAAVGFTTNIKKALYSHIVNLEYKDIDKEGTNSLLSKMTNDLKEIQNGVNLTLRLLARSPFVVFGAAIMAFTVDAGSAVIFAIVIPLMSAVIFSVMLSSIPIFKKVQMKTEEVMTSVREYLYGIRLIRSFMRDKAEKKKFDEKNDSLEKITLFAGKISALMNPLTFIIINGGIIVLLYSGALKVSAGKLSSGQVVALYNYMSQILIELLKLASLIISISKSLGAASRVEAVFETGETTREELSHSTFSASGDDDAVCISDLSFTYEGAGAPAIHGISFSAKKGATIGIIGGTGSGKTTLINLVSGFYRANSGSIKIFGKEIEKYDKTSLRKAFHHVPQKSVLFRGTVRENLLWSGCADDKELWCALETAQAKDFLMKKDGLDTAVGEEGAGFSGGQRQRLCIARAIVGNPSFLILDDSTSALDLATDKALRASLSSLEPKPTTFIVSQRTASVMHSDVIIVLSDGECVGLGTHEKLLSSCETYRDIYDSQFGAGTAASLKGKGVASE